MQRAGAVGGRLNWSSTVFDRAGSITVMLLLHAGPETTHTEHWHRRRGMEYGKVSSMKWQTLRNERQQCVIKLDKITDSLCSRRRSQVGLQQHSSATEKRKKKTRLNAPLLWPKDWQHGVDGVCHLCCGVSLIQQPELHQNRDIFRPWNSVRGLLQQ